jgi:hypothetical protein
MNALTDKHFERLVKTYGTPIKILNLVKKESKNEQKLGQLYDKYLKNLSIQGKRFIKDKCDICYDWFDFFKIYNSNEAELLAYMQKLGFQYVQDVKPTVIDFSNTSKNVAFAYSASGPFTEGRSAGQLRRLFGPHQQRHGMCCQRRAYPNAAEHGAKPCRVRIQDYTSCDKRTAGDCVEHVRGWIH